MVKGLSEFDHQLAIGLAAVRNHKVQQSPFLTCHLLFKQPRRTICQFENSYRFFQIALVGILNAVRDCEATSAAADATPLTSGQTKPARLAETGFVAFAPDALHSLGGYPGNDDEGRAIQRSLDQAKIEQNFLAAAGYLKSHDLSNGKSGAVGFCFGGYIVNMLAATMGDQLAAGVPFYSTPAAKEIRKNIAAPLLIQLAELDQRVNSTRPDYEAGLKANKVEFTMHMYPKTKHGFHNDSTGRYNEEMAEMT